MAEIDNLRLNKLEGPAASALEVDAIEHRMTLAGKDHVAFRDTGWVGNGRQWIFVESFAAWEAAHGGANIDQMNTFHVWTTGKVRAEFESDDADCNFYLESGPGGLTQAWYGVQEGGTHHWSHGGNWALDDTYRFCDGLDLKAATTRFLIRKDGSVSPRIGSAALPSYSFVGDPDTGMYRPGVEGGVGDNLGFVTAGVEAMRITSDQIIRILTMPTTAPALSGSLWNDAGTVKITP